MKYYHILLYFLILASHSLLASEYTIIEQDNRKGLVNNNGNWVIPPFYDDLGWSNGDFSVVDEVTGYKMGEYWGLINIKNIKITLAEYKNIYPLDDQHCLATKPDSYKLNEKYGLISIRSGKTIIPFNYTSLAKTGYHFIAGKYSNDILLYGIIDSKGKFVVDFNYRQIMSLTDDLYAAKNDQGLYDLLNVNGDPVQSIRPDEIKPLYEDLLMITVDGEKGLVSSQGKLLIKPGYKTIKIGDNLEVMGLPQKTWQLLSMDNKMINELSYDQLSPMDKDLYKATRGNYAFIINTEGKVLFKIKDSDLFILNDTLAAVKTKNRYGVINYTGKFIYPLQYDSVSLLSDRIFLLEKNGHNKGWELGDLYGKILSDEKYDRILPINDRFHAVSKHGFWGVSDKYGKKLIETIYDTLLAVNTNKFLVKFHGEYGVINNEGHWIGYPKKGDPYLFQDDRYLVSSYYGSSIFDYYGNEIYHSENYLRPLSANFMVEDYKHKKGLINHFYQTLLPVKFDQIIEISKDSVYLYKNEDGWGAVTIDGIVLFRNDDRFEQIIGSSENYIGVQINDAFGFVDYKGRLRIANRYERIGLYHEGLAGIKILGKWGCIDKKENIVIQPYYDSIEPFKNNLAIAVRDGRYGIIDFRGTIKIPFEYDTITRLREGGFICILNGMSGLIDDSGILKFYPKFDYFEDLKNGYVIVKRNNKYGVLSDDGIIRIPIIHDEIKYDRINHVILVSNRKKWINLQTVQ